MSSEPGPHTASSSAAGQPVGSPGAVLDQQFDRDSLVALRSAVAAHASRRGVLGERLEHIVLVAYELASNAVRHGGGRGRLRLAADDRTIGCTVTDQGGGFREAGQAGLVRPEPTAGGGRGLWLVRCVADSLEIHSGDQGTTAVARFAIR